MGAGDNKSGNVDHGEFFARVEFSECGATGRVALRVCALNHFHGVGEDFRVCALEFGREPTRGDGVRDFLHSLVEHSFDTSVPTIDGADFCAGVA